MSFEDYPELDIYSPHQHELIFEKITFKLSAEETVITFIKVLQTDITDNEEKTNEDDEDSDSSSDQKTKMQKKEDITDKINSHYWTQQSSKKFRIMKYTIYGSFLILTLLYMVILIIDLGDSTNSHLMKGFMVVLFLTNQLFLLSLIYSRTQIIDISYLNLKMANCMVEDLKYRIKLI